MSELVERYVHQVGRYLARGERAEIEAELRSLIYDQLDDRYPNAPTEGDVAAVLAELGDPRKMATSYNRDQYLVGPDLYPTMTAALRYGGLIVPPLVLFFSIFGALVAGQPATLTTLLVEPLLAAGQATLVFSAAVVLVFALIQRVGVAIEPPFDPLALPQVDDPSVVDRAEATYGSAFGAFVILALLYFARVGGLTLQFAPGADDIIPVPLEWLWLLIVMAAGQIALQLWVLRRNRWSSATWLLQTVLEMIALVGLYFGILSPLVQHLVTTNPSLATVPLVGSAAELFAVVYAALSLITRGARLARLWTYQRNDK